MFVESLKSYTDDRGDLYPINFNEIPFQPKRMFIVSEVPKGVKRGDHAHFETEQFLICLKGQVEVILYDGYETVKTVLNPMQGVYVPNLVWDSQIFNTGDDILLVLASTDYDREDYIEDPAVFKAHAVFKGLKK
jgi:UDP-2-acetamido-3-amino-2,3-dideoxy-glucuronate N-acetyltransferase